MPYLSIQCCAAIYIAKRLVTAAHAMRYAASGRGEASATVRENDVTFRMIRFGARAYALVGVLAGALALVPELAAQDMRRGPDLNSPQYTTADMTRLEIEKLLAAGKPPDLSSKSLNGLDFSGLDFSGVNFRAARLNKTKFKGSRLEGAILDQAWAIGADFSGADLTHASLFAAQMQKANFDDADLSDARIAGDFSGAQMRKTKFVRADLSADMTNQSMGLMRAVLRSADLRGADFEGADLAHANLEFAKFAGANFADADLIDADTAGADFRGAILGNTILKGCDVTDATIDASEVPLFAAAAHLDRAIKK